MTKKQIVQEIAEGRGLLAIIAKESIAENKIDQFIKELLGQLKDAPDGLKHIIGEKLFKQLKNYEE